MTTKKKRLPISHALTSKRLYATLGLLLFSQIGPLILTLGSGPVYATIAIGLGLITLIIGAKLYNEIAKNQPPAKIKNVFFVKIMLALMLYIAVITIITKITPSTINTPENQVLMNQLFAHQPIAMVFFIVLVAPITEELIFRELLPSLYGYNIISYIVTAILFTLMHSPTDLISIVSYGGLAIVFTYARLMSKSINMSILTHITWNTLSVTMMIITMLNT